MKAELVITGEAEEIILDDSFRAPKCGLLFYFVLDLDMETHDDNAFLRRIRRCKIWLSYKISDI